MADLRKTVKIKGLAEVKRRLKEIGAKAEKALGMLLRNEGETIMTTAKTLTPVDTGALRASGHVTGPTRTADRLHVDLSFGGPAGSEAAGVFVGYAIPVHEDLTKHHPVGQAKFLEQPVREAARGMAERLAAGLKREVF